MKTEHPATAMFRAMVFPIYHRDGGDSYPLAHFWPIKSGGCFMEACCYIFRQWREFRRSQCEIQGKRILVNDGYIEDAQDYEDQHLGALDDRLSYYQHLGEKFPGVPLSEAAVRESEERREQFSGSYEIPNMIPWA